MVWFVKQKNINPFSFLFLYSFKFSWIPYCSIFLSQSLLSFRIHSCHCQIWAIGLTQHGTFYVMLIFFSFVFCACYLGHLLWDTALHSNKGMLITKTYKSSSSLMSWSFLKYYFATFLIIWIYFLICSTITLVDN